MENQFEKKFNFIDKHIPTNRIVEYSSKKKYLFKKIEYYSKMLELSETEIEVLVKHVYFKILYELLIRPAEILEEVSSNSMKTFKTEGIQIGTLAVDSKYNKNLFALIERFHSITEKTCEFPQLLQMDDDHFFQKFRWLKNEKS